MNWITKYQKLSVDQDGRMNTADMTEELVDMVQLSPNPPHALSMLKQQLLDRILLVDGDRCAVVPFLFTVKHPLLQKAMLMALYRLCALDSNEMEQWLQCKQEYRIETSVEHLICMLLHKQRQRAMVDAYSMKSYCILSSELVDMASSRSLGYVYCCKKPKVNDLTNDIVIDLSSECSDNEETTLDSTTVNASKKMKLEKEEKLDSKSMQTNVPDQTDALVVPPKEVTLSENLIEKLQTLNATLADATAAASNQYPTQVANDMQVTLMRTQNSEEELTAMLKQINFLSISDPSTLVACKIYLTNQTSHKYAGLFISSCLLPKFQSLNARNQQKKASRQLFQSVQHVCGVHPDAVVDSLLIPLVCHQCMSASQFEVINRIIGSCLPHQSIAKFMHLLASDQSIATNWNDFVSTLLKNIFTQLKDKILGTGTEAPVFIANFILKLESVASQFPTSTKFGALCSTFISQYGKLLTGHLDLMRSIVNMNQTFVKNTMNNMLDNLTSIQNR